VADISCVQSVFCSWKDSVLGCPKFEHGSDYSGFFLRDSGSRTNTKVLHSCTFHSSILILFTDHLFQPLQCLYFVITQFRSRRIIIMKGMWWWIRKHWRNTQRCGRLLRPQNVARAFNGEFVCYVLLLMSHGFIASVSEAPTEYVGWFFPGGWLVAMTICGVAWVTCGRAWQLRRLVGQAADCGV